MSNNLSHSLAELQDVGAPVSCRDCTHFQPDTINPPQGAGRCAVTLTGLPPAPLNGSYGVCYPFTPRTCSHFQPLGVSHE